MGALFVPLQFYIRFRLTDHIIRFSLFFSSKHNHYRNDISTRAFTRLIWNFFLLRSIANILTTHYVVYSHHADVGMFVGNVFFSRLRDTRVGIQSNRNF